MNDDILGYVLVTAVAIIPALGITARLALRPVVDAIVRLKETFGEQPGNAVLEKRVVQLEDELQQVREEVQRLREVEAFHRALPLGSADTSRLPSTGT